MRRQGKSKTIGGSADMSKDYRYETLRDGGALAIPKAGHWRGY